MRYLILVLLLTSSFSVPTFAGGSEDKEKTPNAQSAQQILWRQQQALAAYQAQLRQWQQQAMAAAAAHFYQQQPQQQQAAKRPTPTAATGENDKENQSPPKKSCHSSASGQKDFRCSFCPKSFARRATLQEHERIHTGDKPFECPNKGCKFVTAFQSSLLVHKRRCRMVTSATNPATSPSLSSPLSGIAIPRAQQEDVSSEEIDEIDETEEELNGLIEQLWMIGQWDCIEDIREELERGIMASGGARGPASIEELVEAAKQKLEELEELEELETEMESEEECNGDLEDFDQPDDTDQGGGSGSSRATESAY